MLPPGYYYLFHLHILIFVKIPAASICSEGHPANKTSGAGRFLPYICNSRGDNPCGYPSIFSKGTGLFSIFLGFIGKILACLVLRGDYQFFSWRETNPFFANVLFSTEVI